MISSANRAQCVQAADPFNTMAPGPSGAIEVTQDGTDKFQMPPSTHGSACDALRCSTSSSRVAASASIGPNRTSGGSGIRSRMLAATHAPARSLLLVAASRLSHTLTETGWPSSLTKA